MKGKTETWKVIILWREVQFRANAISRRISPMENALIELLRYDIMPILERAATALEQVGANLEKVVTLLSEPTEPPRESNHKQED